MNKTRRFLLVSAASVLLGLSARAQTPGRPVVVNNAADTGSNAAAKKITGIVRQPDGQPAAGLAVQMVGVLAPGRSRSRRMLMANLNWHGTSANSDKTTPPPASWRGTPNTIWPWRRTLMKTLARWTSKLAPGMTLAGRAESGGKLVTNATATLIFWTGNSGPHLTGLNRATNAPGHFEIPAFRPDGNNGVLVSARGYGQESLFDVAASAEAGIELDPFELKVANLTLAGQVLNADDKPVAGAAHVVERR